MLKGGDNNDTNTTKHCTISRRLRCTTIHHHGDHQTNQGKLHPHDRLCIILFLCKCIDYHAQPKRTISRTKRMALQLSAQRNLRRMKYER